MSLYDSVDCPYCEHENELTDVLDGGLSVDNTTDWECAKCEKEFEIHVEFEPTYNASKIIYTDCESCGENVRDVHVKGKRFPYPQNIKETKLCHKCYCRKMNEQYEAGQKAGRGL